MVDPGMERGTSGLVVRSSDYQATRLFDPGVYPNILLLQVGSVVCYLVGQGDTCSFLS